MKGFIVTLILLGSLGVTAAPKKSVTKKPKASWSDNLRTKLQTNNGQIRNIGSINSPI